MRWAAGDAAWNGDARDVRLPRSWLDLRGSSSVAMDWPGRDRRATVPTRRPSRAAAGLRARWNHHPGEPTKMESAKSAGRVVGMLLLLQAVCGYVVNFVLLQPA